MEQNIPQLIKEIVEHHYHLIWETNVKNSTDIDDFEKWAAMMAKMHAGVTLRYMFEADEFEQAYNESINASK